MTITKFKNLCDSIRIVLLEKLINNEIQDFEIEEIFDDKLIEINMYKHDTKLTMTLKSGALIKRTL